jgi:DNA repair exonuclease SbcCD ATPase subunit
MKKRTSGKKKLRQDMGLETKEDAENKLKETAADLHGCGDDKPKSEEAQVEESLNKGLEEMVSEPEAGTEAPLFGEYDNIINVLTQTKREIDEEIGSTTKKMSTLKVLLMDLEGRKTQVQRALEDAREMSGPPEIPDLPDIPEPPEDETAAEDFGGKGEKES